MLSADRPGGKCTVEFEQICGDFPDFEDVKSYIMECSEQVSWWSLVLFSHTFEYAVAFVVNVDQIDR